tara:strand:+ start:1739 stop:3238 length:1500 start_codon:yes stop_codon:yes gene_type:complete
MKIYPQEISDGVADLVQSSASLAYCAPAILCTGGDAETIAFAEKVKAESANPKQLDLYYIKSILVSTGWNKNDDVFTPEATFAARNTPEDKQFNFMHNENDIIGHITGSYVVDKEGNKVEAEEAPKDFDIISEAVLYNSWTDPENRERMKQIIAEIEEGKWFVSMECLFAGFDYALTDEHGKASILQRNEGSAFLTKHLRAYGGTGEYEGRKIGRSLQNISFSGKGLVSKPANPRSVILDASRASSNSVNEDLLTLGGSDMSDTNVLEKQLAEVRSELASAREECVALQASLDEATSKEHTEAVAKLESEIASQAEAIKTLEESVSAKDATITELQESIAKSEEDMKEKMEELRKMKKKEAVMKRKASLLDIGFDEEEAEESLASYEDLDDATFDIVIAAMKKKEAVMKKKEEAAPKKEKEEADMHGDKEKKKKEEEEAVMKKKYASEEEAEAEVAAEEALDEVETSEATLVDASDETDELEATRASVAEWLESNVLSK